MRTLNITIAIVSMTVLMITPIIAAVTTRTLLNIKQYNAFSNGHHAHEQMQTYMKVSDEMCCKGPTLWHTDRPGPTRRGRATTCMCTAPPRPDMAIAIGAAEQLCNGGGG